MASLPLLDEGAASEVVEEGYTEVCILALRWQGRPEGSIAQCVVAVPGTATVGLLESVETHTVPLYAYVNGASVATGEEAVVAILYFGPEFLRDKLVESTPVGQTN
eukprot:166273-Amphidinium_carterae.1